MSGYSYETIKAFAKETGGRITDFLALAPQNDPFYTGTPGDKAQAEWFARIWESAGYDSGVHLRRVHYWTVSQEPPVLMANGLPYQNTEKCWDYLVQASKMARYLGLVRIEQIIDKKNPKPHVHANYDDSAPGYQIHAPNLNEPIIWTMGISNANAQPYHLEVWCEKSTMDDVLLPICNAHHANLVTFEGEVSITACYELIERIKESGGKPTRIFYISDFDPAGNSMPVAMARKVEFMHEHYDCDFDIAIRPLALTPDLVADYKLPRIPIKESEKRAARFEEAFGTGAVELDALEALYPGELGSLVSEALDEYYSAEAEEEVTESTKQLKAELRTRINAITVRYQEHINALNAMQREIQAIELDADDYAVDQYPKDVYEGDTNWLFRTDRPYQAQINYYKAHKQG